MLVKSMLLWTLLGAGVPAATADTRELIEQALSEPTRITLDNVKLVDAFNIITAQTGVRIVMSPEVMRFAPQGGDTMIRKVDIANVTLREGLRRLLDPLGMTIVVAEKSVEIVPKDALLCLGRAPTWPELELLSELSALQLGLDAEAWPRFQSRTQFQVPSPDGWRLLSETVRGVGVGPGDEVLTIACHSLGWTWCLSGQSIIVYPLEQQIRRRLSQPISIRLSSRPLFDVLAAIGDAIRMPVRVEPGAIASLPQQVQRNFDLHAQQKPAEQVLEQISAYTGLGYLAGPEGIVFYLPESGTGGPGLSAGGPIRPTGASDPVMAKLSIPLEGGRSVEWMIRKSELPEDLQQMRQRDLQELIDLLRQRNPAPEKQ